MQCIEGFLLESNRTLLGTLIITVEFYMSPWNVVRNSNPN